MKWKLNLVKLDLGSQVQIEKPSKFKTEHFQKQATGTNLKHSSGSLSIMRLKLVFGNKDTRSKNVDGKHQ